MIIGRNLKFTGSPNPRASPRPVGETIDSVDFRVAAGKSAPGRADEIIMSTPRSDSPGSIDQPIISDFADDTEMAELIEYFLNELQSGIQTLTRACEEGDLAQLGSFAHQLKGAAGGYGFPSITDSAAELESILRSEPLEPSCVTEKAEALIDLCRRAAGRAGVS